MATNKRRRRVQIFDLVVKSSTRKKGKRPNQISVKKALELLQLEPFDTWERPSNNGTINFYCSDFNNKDGAYEFLLNVSNSTLSDPVFSGKVGKTKSRRVVEKDISKNEGMDFSSHVIIKLPSDDIDDLTASSILIECVDGLNINNIIKFFNYTLQNICKKHPKEFQQLDASGAIDDSGNPICINVIYKFEYMINPNDEVIQMLNKSSIKSIILIDDREKSSPLDSNSYFTEKEKCLEISVSEHFNTLKDKWKVIKRLFKDKRDAYKYARIILRQDENKPSKKIDAEISENIINSLSHSFYITTNVDLLSSYNKFCDPILTEMRKFFDGD